MEDNRSNLSTVPSSGRQTAEDRTLQFLQSLPVSNLSVEDNEQSLKRCLEVINEKFSADHGYILLKGEDEGKLEILASAQKDTDTDSPSTFSSAVAAKVMQTGTAILVEEAMNNKDFAGDPNFQRFNIKSALCAVMTQESSPIGVVYLDSSQQQCSWGNEELKLLDFLAGYLGLALDAVQLKQERVKNERLITAGQISLKITHSIKNILQLVSGSAEVIDFGLRTNEIHRVKRSWNIMKPNLDRIKKFMLDMLDFSRERHLELGPCKFNAVVQSAIESLSSQLKQKKAKLHIRVDQQIPTIELDGERIHEMATNLILNAVDIVDDETGVVTVETKYVPEKNVIHLSVTDNGPGISEEAKEKIFQPFQSTKNKLGTGLGLAIAKKIIEQHKSKIEIDSETGKGTTFRVILPAKIIEED
ncbi:MAG: GAF domain-containing sensor histidine kinase [Planctomycetota bacterium]|jgi:signal transduction histidine kinase